MYPVLSTTVTAPVRPIETIPATFFTSTWWRVWLLQDKLGNLCLHEPNFAVLCEQLCLSLLCLVLPQWASCRFWNWTIEHWGVYEICLYIHTYTIYIFYIYICFLYRFSRILVGVLFKLTLAFPYSHTEKSHGGSQDGASQGPHRHRTKDFQPGISSQNQKNSNCRCNLPETNIAPENGWLQDYFPFGKAYFQGLC